MGKEPEKILNEFKERLSSFIGLKIELFKLNAYERVARIIAILSHSLILMLLCLLYTSKYALHIFFVRYGPGKSRPGSGIYPHPFRHSRILLFVGSYTPVSYTHLDRMLSIFYLIGSIQ